MARDVEDEAPVRRRRVVTPTRDDEDDTPRSRTRTRSRDDDDEPRRSRSRDDDEDERPRRQRDSNGGDRSAVGHIRRGYSAAKAVADSTLGYPVLRPDQQSVIFAFAEADPFASFRRHWIERRIDRKTVRRPYLCFESLDRPCPLCDVGDKPTAVSAYNVVEIGDDGELLPKVLEVGIKYLRVLEDYHNDAKIGPLDKPKKYFMVTKSTGGKNGTTTYTYIPVTAATLADEYDIEPPTRKEIEGLKRYDASVFYIPKKSEMEEVAGEVSADADYDDQPPSRRRRD